PLPQPRSTLSPYTTLFRSRYNPEGDRELNRRQAARLRHLSEYLHRKGRSRFMFELLVPAEKAQLQLIAGDKKAYDLELRPRLMVDRKSTRLNSSHVSISYA